jgi:putative acetyltransferase
MTIKRADSDHPDFKKLASELESDLKICDGINHSNYGNLNKIDKLNHVLISYQSEMPIGCEGLRPYMNDRMEIKRMYVRPTYRGQGIATLILTGLEKWSKELGYKYCVLETGKNNYQMTANFAQYEESSNSICFEKPL